MEMFVVGRAVTGTRKIRKSGSNLDSRVRIHPAKFSDPYIIIVVCNRDQFLHVKIIIFIDRFMFENQYNWAFFTDFFGNHV